MAQSAEHLAAVHALGMRHGLLVVTKTDLADPAPVLAQAGAEITATNAGIRIARNGAGIAPVDVSTAPFPEFPTECKQQSHLQCAFLTRAAKPQRNPTV